MPLPTLKPCPHCAGPAHWGEVPGNMKSFPALTILCDDNKCFGGMHVIYDEFRKDTNVEMLRERMAVCWNTRTPCP